MAAAHQAGVEVMPVIFPGYSGYHLGMAEGKERPTNGIPRDCGRFYQAQADGLLRAGATMDLRRHVRRSGRRHRPLQTGPNQADLPAGQGFVALDKPTKEENANSAQTSEPNEVESPREFIRRRMRELDKKDVPTRNSN